MNEIETKKIIEEKLNEGCQISMPGEFGFGKVYLDTNSDRFRKNIGKNSALYWDNVNKTLHCDKTSMIHIDFKELKHKKKKIKEDEFLMWFSSSDNFEILFYGIIKKENLDSALKNSNTFEKFEFIK